MKGKWAGPLLLLSLLMSGCGPPGLSATPRIKTMLRENGKPQFFRIGDYILVEGVIRVTSEGYFVIYNTAGVGRMADRNCLLLTGLKSVWRPVHWKARILASAGTIASVTGVATERFPHFPTPGGGQHQWRTCLAALKVDTVSMR